MIKQSTKLFAVISLVLFLCFSPMSYGKDRPSREYLVKAAFLFNFAKFITWPDQVFTNGDTPFFIGILGADPFGEAIKTIENKSIKNRKIAVRYFSNLSELKRSHILFICRSENSRMKKILAELSNQPVVTIGDREGFIHQGGTINFVVIENKTGFEINLKAAQKAGIKISAKLLNLAKTVKK